MSISKIEEINKKFDEKELRYKIGKIMRTAIVEGTNCPYCDWVYKKSPNFSKLATVSHIMKVHPEKYKLISKDTQMINLFRQQILSLIEELEGKLKKMKSHIYNGWFAKEKIPDKSPKVKKCSHVWIKVNENWALCNYCSKELKIGDNKNI